ncbi:MAG: hypothetical protein ACFFBX_10320 [Promethearchaeota archaeon]
MNISRTIIGLGILTLLIVPLIPLSSVPIVLSTLENNQMKDLEPIVPSPEPPHRILPLKMLVYTEYTDYDQEFQNVMNAINITYGTDYYWTNLTDYNDLASLLPGHDILLIPEQELAPDYATMQTIGTAWGSTLVPFVNAGGIVILMDFAASIPGYGPGLHIFNESGLMTIYGVTDYFPMGTLATVNIVNSSDALARGIAGSFSPQSGTMSVDTNEATIVADDGTNPIVVHKVMGRGHIVFLGFDLYASDANFREILANAIRLHRHVVFDASHAPYGTIFNTLSSFADDLVAEGFAVTNMASFSPALINASDVLVLTTGTSTFTSSEADTVEAFVLAGGGLFIITDYGTFGDELDPVSTRFGFTRYSDYLTDTDDTIAGDSYNVYDNLGGNTNIINHSITVAVSRLELDRPGGLSGLPADALALVTTDTDGTSDWSLGTDADGIPMAAALITSGFGRVSIVMDYNFLNDATDVDSDATNTYFDSNNDDFAINNIRWLSAAGTKERKVLFDNSHTPYVAFGGATYDFANYLTSNGYTFHWMSTFYPSLIDTTDILIISEGITAYSNPEITAIHNFVDQGGGIILLGDWGTYGDNTDDIGQEYGLIRNSSMVYLSDTDDGILLGNSYLIYEGANIGSHPVTQGVNRIEVDRGTGFTALGSGTALVTTDNDGTSEWYDNGINYWPADAVPVFAANTYGLGRVVYLTDVNFIDNGDPDGDGDVTFMDSDNNLFLINAFQWLSANRAPIVTVTYPDGGETVNNTITITWTAIDPNKDPILGYDILFSNDSGTSWYPIDTGIMGTSYVWNTTSVSNGANYLIRVAAFDYELVGIDDSNAVFTIDNPLPYTPPIPPLPWWWWIVAVVIVVVIIVIIIIFLLLRRKGTKS